MHYRLSWYRSLFIINIIVVYIFTGYIFYQSIFVGTVHDDGETIGLTIIFSLLLIYSLNDFWGLNLIKRAEQNIGISQRRIGWIIFGLVLIGIAELLLLAGLSYSLYSFIKTYRNMRFRKVDYEILFFWFMMLLVTGTGAYNFFSSISLLKKVRSNKKEFDEMIRDIGTGS